MVGLSSYKTNSHLVVLSPYVPRLRAQLHSNLIIMSFSQRNQQNRPIMNKSRNSAPLTATQILEIKAYAQQLRIPSAMLFISDNMNTNYGNMFGQEMIYIGTDVYPLPNPPQAGREANSRLTMKSAIAHEWIGHRLANQAGRGFDRGTPDQPNDYGIALDEAQASIRAAFLAPGLSRLERYTLLRDGINRLINQQLKIRQVKHLLYLARP